MRRSNLTVFDEYIVANTTYTTSQELNSALGQMDQLAVSAVVDNTNAAGTLTVVMKHSGDGRNFATKGTIISGASFGATATTMLTASDNGSSPSLAYVQLEVTATQSVHLRIHVTTRDATH